MYINIKIHWFAACAYVVYTNTFCRFFLFRCYFKHIPLVRHIYTHMHMHMVVSCTHSKSQIHSNKNAHCRIQQNVHVHRAVLCCAVSLWVSVRLKCLCCSINLFSKSQITNKTQEPILPKYV